MTEAEARRLVHAVLKAYGSYEKEELPDDVRALPISFGDVDLELAFDDGALRVRALIYRFAKPPSPSIAERLRTAEPKIGALALEGDRITLALVYKKASISRVLTELEALVEESRAWISDGLIELLAPE